MAIRASGKACRRLFRQPLDARPHRHHLALRMAVRAFLRHGFEMAAVMAHQLPPEAVLDEGGRAIGAFQPVPAGAAQRQRRIAPAIEEQQRLVALGQRLRHLLEQRRREPCAGLQRHALHVDEADLGQFRPPVPVLQPHHAVAAAVDVHQRFERRRGGGQHHGEFPDRAIEHRHVARVIGHAVVLLVGALMLLIDDDELQLLPRQEQRRAGAHHDPRRAIRHAAPHPLALARAHVRMPLRRFAAESIFDPREKRLALRKSRDWEYRDTRKE